MVKLEDLSTPHCILLAVQYAVDADLVAVRKLTARRRQAFELGLILQIILTYLPESVEPSSYTDYVQELVTGVEIRLADDGKPLNLSAVEDLSLAQAHKRLHNLHLLPLEHSLSRHDPPLPPLTLFLIHRSYRIDSATGLLELVPPLVVPFLDQSEYLRTWFISTVLPLLRLGYEYYPDSPIPRLETFAHLTGTRAIETLLSNLRSRGNTTPGTRNPGRDLRSLIGPWMCGYYERKKRHGGDTSRRLSTGGEAEKEEDDWESLFEWLFLASKSDFPLVCEAVTEWDGPVDVDMGGYDDGRVESLDENHQRYLELRYAQSALASLYITEGNTVETLRMSHGLLTRLATLLSFDPPQGLDGSWESFPKFISGPVVDRQPVPALIQPDTEFSPDNPLTRPEAQNLHLLELLIFSAYTLSALQYPISIRDLAKLYLNGDTSEQSSVFGKILHSLSCTRKTEEQWSMVRNKLLWLWNWGAPQEGLERQGHGIFGKMDGELVETEILKALLDNGHHSLAITTYIKAPIGSQPLPLKDVESLILTCAMHHYDSASNGNRLRGGMKKASDIVSAFSSHFPQSPRFHRFEALITATHALSFYSLTLQHGVPFQPVNIRVMDDPLSLIQKLLSQNSHSYTHLDDLIKIGSNLVISRPATILNASESAQQPEVKMEKKYAERRVIGMAIQAALDEDDFETAYSYVVNRLSPSTPTNSSAFSDTDPRETTSTAPTKDMEDVSWRAALLAGKYRSGSISMSSSAASRASTSRPELRRLEQRMELLSQALLLAPSGHLEEVIAVWQKCETEMMTLLAQELEAEQRFNDYADRRLPGAFANETIAAVQPRREVGRGAVEEAPMGLFDVARGAAAAFSKTAFPLKSGISMGMGGSSKAPETTTGRLSSDSDRGSFAVGEDGNRARKRDMVASAVTGGLASGLGWVLGAKPVPDHSGE
ncbi:secretory pathway Sec39 [Delitschia confertaspora ATCC 74209]|uniref:Secretory pathway Sec39 n=1 Tax=Delitschia confertaspora ATCC 74209 TaxID=1513339 RepID=A0A9P4JJ76_9PLEO|nr:secretory pathway Sec39 [Delitschia confertaspora ATCC 74209]